jgi:hypothetical protein
MTRQPLTMTDTVLSALRLLAEDDPEALEVLTKLYDMCGHRAIFTFFDIEDMGMRGKQIAVACQFFNLNVLSFMEGCSNRNADMIKRVNEQQRLYPADTPMAHTYNAASKNALGRRGQQSRLSTNMSRGPMAGVVRKPK